MWGRLEVLQMSAKGLSVVEAEKLQRPDVAMVSIC
jgi:hypothetical protein